MKTLPNRVVIYTKDVSNITGLRNRAARKLLSDIRRKLNKNASSFITVQEFAAHTGIREDLVNNFLR
jgi:hypothetical protein